MSTAEGLSEELQTPSICFNFDESNQKTDVLRDYVPYQYSVTNNKGAPSLSLKKQKIQLVTPPPCSTRGQDIDQNLKTEEFFEDFDRNFIVKFDESPDKINLFLQNNDSHIHIEDDSPNGCGQKAHKSNISEPFSNGAVENEEENQKIVPPTVIDKKSKHPFEIRKRIAFKNSENLIKNKQNPKNKSKKIINQENLLIVTSNCWTGLPQTKKIKEQYGCLSTKNRFQKTLKKDYVFNHHNIFKETLRSTTLDNWRKKHSRKRSIEKKSSKAQTIFHKPFRLK